MEMPDRTQAKRWEGWAVVDRDGQALGTCTAVFADTDTGVTEWLHVDVEGEGRSFVPAVDAVEAEDAVRIRFPRAAVLGAPRVGDGVQLSQQDEVELYAHYEIAVTPTESESLLPADASVADGPRYDEASDTGTSDEGVDQLHVVAAEPEIAAEAPAAPATVLRRVQPTQPQDDVRPAADVSPPAVSSDGREAGADGSAGGRPASDALSTAAPLAAVAALAAAVALGLRARDRRARRRRSPAARAARLRQELSAGSASALRGASTSLAVVPGAARRTGRQVTGTTSSVLSGAGRELAAAEAALSRSARQLTRTASSTSRPVTRTTRRLGRSGSSTSDAVGRRAGQVTGAVAAAPASVAAGGRRVRRSIGRTLWDLAKLGAAGGGYVLGARAGREQYDLIVEQASQIAALPQVQAAKQTLTDPDRRAQAVEAARPKVESATAQLRRRKH